MRCINQGVMRIKKNESETGDANYAQSYEIIRLCDRTEFVYVALLCFALRAALHLHSQKTDIPSSRSLYSRS